MIDFIRFKVIDPDIQQFRDNPALNWFDQVNIKTGEMKKKAEVDYKKMTLQLIHNRHLYICGSIHQHWNYLNTGIKQNYNDFTFSDLYKTIIQLCKSLNLKPDQCKLENIEFGVNINPLIPANDFLKSVIDHKGEPFTREYKENMRFRDCKRQRYIIKIYNKGLPYKHPGNILRFEHKTVRMIHIEYTGIQYLSDLLNITKINSLGAILRRDFDDLLIYDYTIPINQLNARERLILTQGQNPVYWVELRKTNPNNYPKKRQRFRELIKRYGSQDLQAITGNLITEKWNQLIKTDPKTLQELTDLFKSINQETDCKTLQELTDLSNTNITGINQSGIRLNSVISTTQEPTQANDTLSTGSNIIITSTPPQKTQGREWKREYFIPVVKVSTTGEKTTVSYQSL